MGSEKLRVGGAWNGVLELNFEEWTVPMLREEVAKRSGCSDGPQAINLISSGKVLKDGDGAEKLSQLGLRNNSKVMATRVSADQGKLKQEFLAEEERCKRLSRLKSATTLLAQRHADGSFPIEDFNLELENQSGETVKLGSETDQRSIMMGLMLHTNAKHLIKKHKYRDALEVLTMGEEAFSLCDPRVIEMVDNVSILQIDMVWCYFMLHDISWLTEAGVRLAKAREGLERAYGKEAIRMRLIQGQRFPELALYLRLELLEAVVAYHSGQFEKSRDALSAAQMKYSKLQVPDEALSLLMGMGYKESDAKRALRMNNQDVESAVDFLVEEKSKKAIERQKNLQRQKEILEQKRYGITPLKKAVDLQKLKELVFVGFEKTLAAEALRRNENDTQKALDDLTNPTTNAAIQAELQLRKSKRLRQAEEVAIQALASMGFPRTAVAEAIRRFGTKERALNYLLGRNQNEAPAGAGSLASDVAVGSGSSENNAASSSAGTGAGHAVGPDEEEADDGGEENTKKEEEQRDFEMEDEIKAELQGRDAFSDYEIDVTKEGEAISEYLTLLSSVQC
ncbi:OLC1v1038109C3 [Oldenlandia corymbosa var. corymbosa]|uniref:OLC1v1038109C3 n=1 Tax=Oldenlandia corymbosa var. corymbosa TaxID=529605 RepID=A0AAV1CZ63_OLDCO|nr:OLC1v1038109C3 [Oldenlandia corymbosa var. corymbosa]